MKCRKHETGVIGGCMSQFTIFQVEELQEEVLNDIIATMKGRNIIEYCLFIGKYSLVNKIAERIVDQFTVQWIGDNYCIASRKSDNNYYVPKAEIIEVDSQQFLMSLRGTRIIYKPKFNYLDDIANKDNVHIVLSCDNEYDPEKDIESATWIYHPNHPTFHAFVNNKLNLDIHDCSLRLDGVLICMIFIPYWQIESLLRSIETHVT